MLFQFAPAQITHVYRGCCNTTTGYQPLLPTWTPVVLANCMHSKIISKVKMFSRLAVSTQILI